jgi:hypothetical protein
LGIQACAWNNFTLELRKAGITLQESVEDKLLWNGGDASGILSVRNCYKAIMSTQNLPIRSGWRYSIWKWRLQLNIILFFWLVTEQRILTWDTLQKKGWVGPGLCHLCRAATEDSTHIFIHCQFSQAAWSNILSILNLNCTWRGQDLNECMELWLQNKAI